MAARNVLEVEVSRDTADVVIVGAGVMGLSIAYQISRRDDPISTDHHSVLA